MRACVCVCVYIRKEGDPEASFPFATTQRCRGGRNPFPCIAPFYLWSRPYNFWVLSKEASSTIWAFGMTRPGIEPQFSGHWRTFYLQDQFRNILLNLSLSLCHRNNHIFWRTTHTEILLHIPSILSGLQTWVNLFLYSERNCKFLIYKYLLRVCVHIERYTSVFFSILILFKNH